MNAPGFTHVFTRAERHFRSAMQYLPHMVGNDARNFFLESFRQRAWANNGMEQWPRRKARTKWGKADDPSRALLVLSGRLRRSIRIMELHFGQVTVGSDVPYARMHNEGFRGGFYQRVKAHQRKTMGRKMVIIRNRSLRRRTDITWGKPQTGVHTVRPHIRRITVKLPKRQFMGESQYLNRILQRRIQAELMKGLR